MFGRRKFLSMLLTGVLLASGLGSTASAQVFLKPKEAITLMMPEADSLVPDRKELTPELKNRLQSVLKKRVREKEVTFYIGMKQDTPTAYAIILNMIGKERPITFMVCINPDGTVRSVEVLIYRESQGFEIRGRRFMNQFKGKTIASPLKVGRDIHVISGATLSSRSATYVVKKALALFDLFYKKPAMENQ